MTRDDRAAGSVVNALTIDVEDYFHVSAFDDVVDRSSWDGRERRVVVNTDRLLALLDRAQVRATFFVLGWVADREPALVRRIAAAGHEVACHSYAHRLVYDLTPDAFRDDLRRAKACIEEASGLPVIGYRAPSYSITARSLWALDALVEEGFRYDASIFPVHHDRYGIPDAPRHAHQLERAAGSFLEIPPATLQRAGLNLPVAGGGYFRLLPYSWTRYGLGSLNRREGVPGVFYLHPWEIDPDQPRLPVPWLTRVRHYRNLHRTEPRLGRLLADFRFAPVASVFAGELAAVGATRPRPPVHSPSAGAVTG